MEAPVGNPRKALPKIDTNSLRDPVAEFVPAQDPDGDLLPELPGGLHRTVMPSPRGGFFANKMDPLHGELPHRPRHTPPPGKDEAQWEKALEKDPLENEISKLIRCRSEERFDRVVLKDKIDGVATPRGSLHTPRRDRAFDALTSPRK